MRILLALLILTGPAAAWEFSVDRLCRLTHDEAGVRVEVTYDPAARLYAIEVTRDAAWPAAPIFSIRFSGPRGLTISTSRQSFPAPNVLRVEDTGFGNVLGGLEFNRSATAMLGAAEVTVSLAGAAPEVQRFRDCLVAPAV